MNEPVWQTALSVTDFFCIELRQGGTVLYKTFVRVLFDKKNIYFGVYCWDSAGKKGLRMQDLRHNFLYDNTAFKCGYFSIVNIP